LKIKEKTLMKKWLPVVGWAVFFLFSPLVCLAQQQHSEGRQIMETQMERHKVKTARDHVVMLLIDKDGARKIRELKRYAKEDDNDLRQALIVFTSPSDLKGTTLLTIEASKGEYRQWLHLPGQTSLQRIAEKSKRTAFMGSDFTYEDLQPEDPDNYVFSLAEPGQIDGHDCFVIDITPADRETEKNSAYSRRRAWVRKDIYFTLKIEFYDKRDQLVKTQTSHDLKHSHDTVWYAEKVLMENLQKNHKTLMGIKTKEVNVPIDDALFTEKTILSNKHL
jgi:outer membrane lipoprotein-sorting protein